VFDIYLEFLDYERLLFARGDVRFERHGCMYQKNFYSSPAECCASDGSEAPETDVPTMPATTDVGLSARRDVGGLRTSAEHGRERFREKVTTDCKKQSL
jgi:hypothetical protein